MNLVPCKRGLICFAGIQAELISHALTTKEYATYDQNVQSSTGRGPLANLISLNDINGILQTTCPIQRKQGISDYRPFITPPARRAWRSYKFAPFLFFSFFPVSKVGAPLMGDTAVHSLSHDFKLNF